MSEYVVEIQAVVNAALNELSQEHQSGKLSDAPIANNHFLIRWVTRAIKTQRFHHCVAKDLIAWQKIGRSKGNQAGFWDLFKRISLLYGELLCEDNADILDSDIESFLDRMEGLDWEVSTSEPLTNCGKTQLFTDGQKSLGLCANQCDDCFDGAVLVKPMSFFVRGNHAEFVEQAYQAGFLLHKVTDYKSSVKYHGEYLIFPKNQGQQLAELPFSLLG